jgi:hypothetical protein
VTRTIAIIQRAKAPQNEAPSSAPGREAPIELFFEEHPGRRSYRSDTYFPPR